MREPWLGASHVRNLSPPAGAFLMMADRDPAARVAGFMRSPHPRLATCPRGEAPILCIAQVKRSEPRERSAGLGNVFALNKPHPKPRQRRQHKAYGANRRSRRTRSMREPWLGASHVRNLSPPAGAFLMMADRDPAARAAGYMRSPPPRLAPVRQFARGRSVLCLSPNLPRHAKRAGRCRRG
ncbi:hypothetical protein CA51_10010 [Rosistilla oblonga]|nr:hypothetical protein CA51_10010 [Rosistilla oblonga]